MYFKGLKDKKMAVPMRLELMTCSLGENRSILLSYGTAQNNKFFYLRV